MISIMFWIGIIIWSKKVRRKADGRKIFVEKFSSTRHFVDTALRRQAFRRNIFVDTALRRHDTSSTQHFVDTTLRRQSISSTQYFVDTNI